MVAENHMNGQRVAASPDIAKDVRAKLELSRRDLLDLGLRNPLLNYRSRKTYTVEVVDERSAEIFRLLVAERKTMTFVPAGSNGRDAPSEDRHVDRRLQTNLASSSLQAKLLATHYSARSFIEEQGANILFIALGMLHWYEAESSEELRKAPLILIPVRLDRSSAREKFKLSYSEDEVQANFSLEAKLKTDFAIKFPLPSAFDDLDVNGYFDSVETSVSGQHRWQVDRDSIALSFFSFGKFLMYRDLDEAVWPDDTKPSSNQVLEGLFLGTFDDPPLEPSEQDQLDDHLSVQDTHHVVEADSSQALALIAAVSGRHLVIQGPPGTGKSQTITNLIADAVMDGKKVLFVAEKMAALEVVKRRLDNIGLGDICLELHSHKSNKRAVVTELDRTLQLGPPLENEFDLSLLEAQRKRLNDYAAAVNRPIGASSLSPHQVMALLARRRQRLGEVALPRLKLGGVTWTATDFRRKLALVREVESELKTIGIPDELPLRESRRKTLYDDDLGTIEIILSNAMESLGRVQQITDEYCGQLKARVTSAPDAHVLLDHWGRYFWKLLSGSFRKSRRRLIETLQAHESAIDKITEALEIRSAAEGKALFKNLPFIEQRQYLSKWRTGLARLENTVRWNYLNERLAGEELQPVAELGSSWATASSYLSDTFSDSWEHELLDSAVREREPLQRFARESHEQVLKQFQQLDRELIDFNRSRVARFHWDHLPRSEAGGQRALLGREVQKKARHLPIRQLLLKAGNVVQAIKPVFMMSPLSVASFLDPLSARFDLVIFDEASQVKPVDAFGAILRGKQVVVVGDGKQLPPTSFFDALLFGDEDVSEEEASITSDIESILGLFAAHLTHGQRMLRWHYRSKHESLIAVSNHEFYDDRLVIFPSAERSEMGLVFRHLPDTTYDRGKSRTNRLEGRAVALAVIEHARKSPQMTLGVAAFSVAQMNAILDVVEQMRAENPDCEPFFASHPEEPFFVKNLETVQGDERDVIFISVGYGRDAGGFLDMNFGPLNRDGGERRLNVLITRARLRCEVFSNIRADDIRLDRTNARGVRVLKTFLAFADTGNLDLPLPTGRPADSVLEESIASALRSQGLEVETQVGCAGFFVDIGIVDPHKPGRYILGVECDGALYHSARSARDRDRLRQNVLESLGWRLHRVWSTDWFKHPDRELRRVLDAIEDAKKFLSFQGANERVAGNGPPDLNIARARQEIARKTSQAAPISTVPQYPIARLHIQLGARQLHEVHPIFLQIGSREL